MNHKDTAVAKVYPPMAAPKATSAMAGWQAPAQSPNLSIGHKEARKDTKMESTNPLISFCEFLCLFVAKLPLPFSVSLCRRLATLA